MLILPSGAEIEGDAFCVQSGPVGYAALCACATSGDPTGGLVALLAASVFVRRRR